MNLIVFSFNRPLQLHSFLKTLQLYFLVEKKEINIIYKATTDAYFTGYQKLQALFPQVHFHLEEDDVSISFFELFAYKKNLYRYLKNPSLRRHTTFKKLVEEKIANSPYELIVFFTDDSIFTKNTIVPDDALKQVEHLNYHKAVFSLRHGNNLSPKPTDILKVGQYFSWKIRLTGPDLLAWSYRFSVDGHIYNRKALLPIIRRLNYVNPNSFEGFVNDYITLERPDLFSTLLYNNQSSLVGFILNKVQTFNNNENLGLSTEWLNDKFLAGYELIYLFDDYSSNLQPKLKGIRLINESTRHEEVISF